MLSAGGIDQEKARGHGAASGNDAAACDGDTGDAFGNARAGKGSEDEFVVFSAVEGLLE